MRRRMVKTLVGLLALCLVWPLSGQVYAQDGLGHVVIAKDEVRGGTTVLGGQHVVVEGTVQGDLYAAGQTVTINGIVEGDLIAGANVVKVNGEVRGDVRAAGQAVHIHGQVGKNVSAWGQNVSVEKTGQVAGELQAFAQYVDVDGRVARHVLGGGQMFNIKGEVGGDVQLLGVDDLRIAPSAAVAGKLFYRAPHPGNIAPGVVSGEVEFVQEEKQERKEPLIPFGRLMAIASLLLLWLLLRSVLPTGVVAVSRKMEEQLLGSMGVGAIVLLAAPVAFLLLLMTVLGIPASLLGIAVYLILIYLSKVFVGIWLGGQLSRLLPWRLPTLVWELLGVVLLWLVAQLPFVGWLISLLTAMLFMGSLALAIFRPDKPPLPAAN